MLDLNSQNSSPQTQNGFWAGNIQPSVLLKNVSKFYDSPRNGKAEESKQKSKVLEANKNISLEIRTGEIFGLLGPNGAGKTTLVNQILGLTRPDNGSILVEGIDVISQPDKVKEISSYLPQAAMNFGTI